jgi:hypothetical protein
MDTTRWFKYDRDYLCVNTSQFVPVIFEPHCRYLRLGKEYRMGICENRVLRKTFAPMSKDVTGDWEDCITRYSTI